jgi:leader peptidase (prepilin peptidase)/N-methyltransferase
VLWIISIILAGIDLRTMKLPNVWVALGFVMSILLTLQLLFITGDISFVIRYIVAATLTGGFYVLLTVITRGRGMGFGDVKLAPILAGSAALISYPVALIAIIIPFLLGTLMVMYRIIKKIPWRGKIMPFGPLLIAGAWIAALWGESLWSMYSSTWM